MNKQIQTPREIVSKNKLLEAGVYFGHRKSYWNPKMKDYIVMAKKGTHIFDLSKTKKQINFAYHLIEKLAEKDAIFIFVGTRNQASDTIKQNALRTNSHYVSHRWLGGTFTNSKTIFKRVKRMEELEKLQEEKYVGYTKKEILLFEKELQKLQKNLTGIRNMRQKPNVMIIADPRYDKIAVTEAKKVGIKVIGIVDTNVDPDLVDVVIPANDDSIKSVDLIITILADAIAKTKGAPQLYAFQKDENILLPKDLSRPINRNKNKKTFNSNNKFQKKVRFIRNNEETSSKYKIKGSDSNE